MKRLPSISVAVFALILSVMNAVLYNIPFLNFIAEHSEGTAWQVGLLITMVVIVLLALHYIVFSLLLHLLRYVGRVLIAIFFFLSGTCIYFISVYHNLMDESMMVNVFNTRYSEASGFFSPGLFITIALLGLLPAIYVLVQKTHPMDKRSWKTFGWSGGGALLLSAVLAVVNLNQVLWIGKYDTELGGLVMPWSYIVNTGLHFAHQSQAQAKEIPLPDATITDTDPSAVVLVIGESARKANFQLYGYNRPTNPRLSQINDLHVLDAHSCATYTVAGVKAILEHMPTGDLYEILPNYLFRTGVDVSWRTRNWGEPPVHIDEYLTIDSLLARYDYRGDVFDDLLFTGLRERIESSDKNKVLIILHTSTSHGPDYQRQYPEPYSVFMPVCSSVENAQNEPDRLLNAYDNTIVYTDALLADLIDSLRTLTDWKCAMFYVSDHGESLGENGLFMHGVPMKMAPKEQYEIPFLVWTNDSSRTILPPDHIIDQHYVFHSVLDWLSIESPIYNPEYNLFK